MRNFNQCIRTAAWAAALGLGTLACGGGETSSDKATSVSTASTPETARTAGKLTLTFDYLGGGSRVINVYEDPTVPREDAVVNGTYYDGEDVEVMSDCITRGRLVEPDIDIGERGEASDGWIEIDEKPSNPDIAQWAALTYAEAESRATIEARLDDC